MGDQVKGGSKGWGQVNRVEMGVGVEGWGWGWGVCGGVRGGGVGGCGESRSCGLSDWQGFKPITPKNADLDEYSTNHVL